VVKWWQAIVNAMGVYVTRGKASTLDHIVASTGMRDVAAAARVTGYCAVAGCADLTGPMPAASKRLSDHCPVVVDIQDRDLD
jgi:hypothetical protein